MLKSYRLLSVAILLGIALAAPGHADILYSNFGTGQTYILNSGYSIGPTCGIGDCAHAVQFSPSATGTLGGIDVALGYITGTNSVTVELASDSGGSLGSVLESWTTAALGAFGTNNPTVFLSSPLSLTLNQGTMYWLVMLAGDSTFEAWNQNSIGDMKPSLLSTDGGGSWTSVGVNDATAFDVVGPVTSSVPEPSSLLLLGTMLVIVGLGTLRRNNPHSQRASPTINT